MTINDHECIKAGLDPEKVQNLGRRLERIARDCWALRIMIFGGSGMASLRFDDDEGPPLILANLNTCNVDGGDGASWEHDDGYERGE